MGGVAHIAFMDENGHRLGRIVDLLGPNMWLELDRVSFPAFFGRKLDATAEEREEGFAEARAFAHDRGAVFIGDALKKIGRFGRPFVKKNHD